MSSYSVQREGLIVRFDQRLKDMVGRRGRDRYSDCFVTFLENPPSGLLLAEAAVAKATPELVTADILGAIGDGVAMSADETFMAPHFSRAGDEIQGVDPRSNRYLQFAFMKHGFYMELPNNTLFADEAL